MSQHGDHGNHQPGTQRAYVMQGMEYYLYMPPGNPPPGGWPILLFTHGIGEASQTYSAAAGWIEQSLAAVKRHGSPAYLCDAPEGAKLLNAFIVISPQFPFTPDEQQRAKRSRPWQWADRADTIKSILESTLTNFEGNAQRIYATGFSRGARGALAIAQHLEKEKYNIAKLILVDSESDPTPGPDIPVWIHYAGPHTLKNIVEGHQGTIKKLGDKGWTNAPPDAPTPAGERVFTDWNLKSQVSVENHTNVSKLAYSDRRVYEWLLQQPHAKT